MESNEQSELISIIKGAAEWGGIYQKRKKRERKKLMDMGNSVVIPRGTGR